MPELKGTSFAYKFIGRGAQYRVYSIRTLEGTATGRVLKVPLVLEEIESAIEPHAHTNPLLPYQTREEQLRSIASTLLVRRQAVPRVIEGANGDHVDLINAIGDLKVLPRTIPQTNVTTGETVLPVFCTQREMIPLSSFFEMFRFSEQYPERLTRMNIVQIELLLEQLCELNHTLWRYGFFELSFNMRNFGVFTDSNHQLAVALLDVGEIITDGGQAKERMQLRPWLYNVDAFKQDYTFVPAILHGMFEKLCQRYFSVSAFEKQWQHSKKAFEARHQKLLRQQELQAEDPNEQVYIWIKRQSLSQRLYRGMRSGRIEEMEFMLDDIRMLQNDVRLETNSLDTQVEYAERKQSGAVWQPEPF